MTRQDLGRWGEVYVMHRLRAHGFDVCFGHKGVESDLVVSNETVTYNVEVKTATKGKDRKWRATLMKSGKYGKTDHNKADVVVFICQNDAELTYFIIPVKAVINRRHLVITSNPRTYSGRWAQYRRESLVI